MYCWRFGFSLDQRSGFDRTCFERFHVTDLVFVLLTVALFIVLAFVVKGVEHL